ncbi:hypothetical protein MYX07_04875 [Patescibacteria group bacterium AH-259-L07]|nr:hypothetical protein [Patescibacteria group bacterium AH-259-L07]
MTTRTIFYGIVVPVGLVIGTVLGYLPAVIPIASGIAAGYIKIQAWRESKGKEDE